MNTPWSALKKLVTHRRDRHTPTPARAAIPLLVEELGPDIFRYHRGDNQVLDIQIERTTTGQIEGWVWVIHRKHCIQEGYGVLTAENWGLEETTAAQLRGDIHRFVTSWAKGTDVTGGACGRNAALQGRV